MHTAIINPDGRLHLGEAARDLGFEAGAVVEIITASSGSLILRVADAVPLEAPCRAVEGEHVRPALAAGRRAR